MQSFQHLLRISFSLPSSRCFSSRHLPSLRVPRLLLLPVPKIPSPVLVIILPRFFNRTRPIPMRIRGSKTPPLNSSSAPTPSPSPPSNSPSSNGSSSRCEGLDLLVLAVIQVNGHGALDAEKNAGNGVEEEEDRIEKMEEEKGSEVEVDAKLKRRRRQLAVPSRYQDSVLQPWKRQNRRRLIGAKRSE